jgi:adenylate cyclase
MAALGLPEPRADHAAAAAHLARAMMASVERIAADSGSGIAVRIGIHAGPVIAGVIGRKKFSYDVWGQTVNIASRMESHGEAGKINVSAAFARLVSGSFELHDRGEIAVKGSGQQQAFFLGPPLA